MELETLIYIRLSLGGLLDFLDVTGKFGIVMPRSLLNGKGSEAFRKVIFQKPSLCVTCTLSNKGRWVFDMEPRYTVSLICFSKCSKIETGLKMLGPFSSLKEFEKSSMTNIKLFSYDDVFRWNDSLSIPIFPRFFS